uniref:Uncharacterized protein n=1 Tax=Vespula pensylvanica TaxID=30213 RepID=A0A834MY37_VESPE|nr:hypothetical protein H0235_017871 [Vespula pensylvanica]
MRGKVSECKVTKSERTFLESLIDGPTDEYFLSREDRVSERIARTRGEKFLRRTVPRRIRSQEIRTFLAEIGFSLLRPSSIGGGGGALSSVSENERRAKIRKKGKGSGDDKKVTLEGRPFSESHDGKEASGSRLGDGTSAILVRSPLERFPSSSLSASSESGAKRGRNFARLSRICVGSLRGVAEWKVFALQLDATIQGMLHHHPTLEVGSSAIEEKDEA